MIPNIHTALKHFKATASPSYTTVIQSPQRMIPSLPNKLLVTIPYFVMNDPIIQFSTSISRYQEKYDFLSRIPLTYWTKLAFNFYQDELYRLKQTLVQQHSNKQIPTEQAQLLYDETFLLFHKIDRILNPQRKLSRSQLYFGYKILE